MRVQIEDFETGDCIQQGLLGLDTPILSTDRIKQNKLFQNNTI